MSDFPVLETPRLLLREIVEADAPTLLEIHGDAAHMRWFGSDPLTDLPAALKLVEVFAGWRKTANPGARWALQPKGQDALVGTCGLFTWNRAWRRCSVGYELAPGVQGRGYMREALGAVLAWGFEHMELHRVEALIHPMNTPSLKLAASLGFVQEGLLREVCRWGGQQHDMLQCALLQREFVRPGP
jgi:[ribosomal protein S5]-alanine N-acetyltransferase